MDISKYQGILIKSVFTPSKSVLRHVGFAMNNWAKLMLCCDFGRFKRIIHLIFAKV